MSNDNKVKLLSERTSGVPPVIFLRDSAEVFGISKKSESEYFKKLRSPQNSRCLYRLEEMHTLEEFEKFCQCLSDSQRSAVGRSEKQQITCFVKSPK